MQFIRRNILLLVVFVTGACILVIELAALRVLTPFFGNTIFSATSVITTILLSLSVGYYIGGRISDKHPKEHLFYLIILSSGILVLLMYILILILIPSIAYSLSITTGPLIVSLILFLVPSLLLGMLSPYVITLQKIKSPKDGIGKVSGNVFFVSTLGSICGSLLTGFYLIPHFGAKQIILATGFVLIAVGGVGYFIKGKNTPLQIIVIVVSVLALSINSLSSSSRNIIYSKDGFYTNLRIVDLTLDDRPARVFLQDSSFASGMYLDGDDLAFEYLRYYELYKLTMEDLENVYIIGAGTYSLPKAFVNENDRVIVDVVDIEPGLEELAKKYFDLPDNDRIVTHITDGRRYLYDSDKSYDVIFGDVYFSLYSIPSQFTTVEFFELARSKMSDEGMIVINVIGSLDEKKNEFLLSEMKTFAEVFPNNLFFATEDLVSEGPQNFVFVGSRSEKNLKDLWSDSQFDSLAGDLLEISDEKLDDYLTLTDNFAPVDYMNAKILMQ